MSDLLDMKASAGGVKLDAEDLAELTGIVGRFAAWPLKGQWACNRPGVVHTLHGLSFHPYQDPWANRVYIAVEKAAAKRTD